jgi:glycosyltransferase involved in cell wall biosynthesis
LNGIKVSVCVITYNHGELLRECLQSIVEQKTDFNYEIIVGDDCSTDGITRTILKEFADSYPKKIVPLLHSKNQGGRGTQNWLNVMRQAKGEYLAHIDGDDRMLPLKLQKQAHFLDIHQDCSVVAHDLRTFDHSTNKAVSKNFEGNLLPQKVDLDYLLINRCFFGHSSKMFRRTSMITLHREKPTVDFFMHIEHAMHGKIGYINEVLGEYRTNQQSITNSSEKAESLIDAYDDAFKRALELGAKQSSVKKGQLRHRYSGARFLLDENRADEAIKLLKLRGNEWIFASVKHRLLACLSIWPSSLRMIVGVKTALISLTKSLKESNM